MDEGRYEGFERERASTNMAIGRLKEYYERKRSQKRQKEINQSNSGCEEMTELIKSTV